MSDKKISRREFLKKYGIGGLSALILLALPSQVKAGVNDNISSAEGTSFDDSITQLGASNVQKAIENVKGSVDTLDTNKADKSDLKELAPKSHASADTTYGAGTGSNYGHVKLSDIYSNVQANSASANGVAASQNAVANAYAALNTAKANKSQLTDGSVTKVGTATVGGSNTPIYLKNGVPNACNEFAPKSHAAADTTYGAGTGLNYGHVKLSDTYATEQSNVGAGNSVAASAYALQQAYKTLNNNLDNYLNLTVFDDYGTITDALTQTIQQGIYRFEKNTCTNLPSGVIGGTILTLVVSGDKEILCSVRLMLGYSGSDVNIYTSIYSAGLTYGTWHKI